MTIQEAIKSGKAFKRPHFHDWVFVDEKFDSYWQSTEIHLFFDVLDILADDWIVREE